MRLLHLLALVSSTSANYGDAFEPFPTCADCLPAAVYEAPGLGFSLSFSSGTAATHLFNGTVQDIAIIAATPDYTALMARLATSPHPSPLSRWERWRRSINKQLGRPATPDVGVLGAMLISLRDTASTATGSRLDRVAVSHPRIQGLREEDVWDALEFASLRPWVAKDLPRPRITLPLPSAGAYPTQLTEAYAVFASHGHGLCEHHKNYWQCEHEQSKVPPETTLVVGFTQSDLWGEIIRTQSAFTDLQPRKADRVFVDLEAGLASRGGYDSESAFWDHVAARLQAFTRELPGGLRLTEVFLAGENATHPAFLNALSDALVGNGYILGDGKSGDAGTQVLVVKNQGNVIDPAFASARGAAQYARWRQEAPVGCQEEDRCVGERRQREKVAELR